MMSEVTRLEDEDNCGEFSIILRQPHSSLFEKYVSSIFLFLLKKLDKDDLIMYNATHKRLCIFG
jgi:hypothetical protein